MIINKTVIDHIKKTVVHTEPLYSPLAYWGYEILIGGIWIEIDIDTPLSEQTCGMEGYRLTNDDGVIIKDTTIPF